jgi:hypothetical protein
MRTAIAPSPSLTNVRVVDDPAAPTGYKLDLGPFPGWKDVTDVVRTKIER